MPRLAVAGPGPGADRLTRIVSGAALLLAAWLLIPSLGTYPGPSLLVWEATTADALEEPMRAGVSPLAFLARRLLWEDGVVSAGQTALFFGPLAYPALLVSPTPAALRLPSALAAMASVGLAAWFAARHETRATAPVLAFLVALSPLVLYYGRYGSCLAGTILSVWLAVFACWEALAAKAPGVRHGAAAAVALALATLQYAPARLAALWLFSGTLAVLATRAIRRRTSFGAAAALLLVVGAFAGTQVAAGRGEVFLRARGEQLFSLLNSPKFVADVLGRPVPRERLTLGEKATLAARLARRKAADLAAVLRPRVPHPAGDLVVHGDPPVLSVLAAALAPFALFGAARALSGIREPRNALLIGLLAAISLPLLLTNRVDAHRAAILVVPLLILAARGAVGAAEAARRARAPKILIAAGAALLAGSLGWDVARSRAASVAASPLRQTLANALASRPEPFALAIEGDHRDVGTIGLALRARRPRPGLWPATSLPESLRLALRADSPERRRRAIQDLESPAAEQPILLGPDEFYGAVRAELPAAGFEVAPAAGEGDAALSWVTYRPPPLIRRDSPFDRHARRVPLHGSEAVATWGELAPPRPGEAWNGGPFQIAGHDSTTGIGLHAPASLTFRVPPDAVGLEALVGFAPDAATCDKPASVIFEVRNEAGRLLQATDLLRPSGGPRLLTVPLAGAKAIVIAVAEGPDGRDCDHAAIADPAWVMKEEEPP